jgi:membrane protein
VEVRKVYQLYLIFLLNIILLISRDRETTIYLCAAINILFWWNNRRYLKYSVEKWKLQNLIISLFKLSTILYFILICGFLIDLNTVDGSLFVGVILSSELLLFFDSTIPRWILYIFYICIFYLKFEGFVDFLLGGIGFQFLFDMFYTEEFIDYIVSENKTINNNEYLFSLKKKIKRNREKIKIRLGIFTIAFVILRYIDASFSNDLSTLFPEINKIVLLFIVNYIKFFLAIGIAIGIDIFISSKKAAELINRK